MDASGSVGSSSRCASMKVPPKRKGNHPDSAAHHHGWNRLNESPSEKEGKLVRPAGTAHPKRASMKVPPKRKGN